jgi:dihydroorotate dehydrogenase electron transfer subunit
MRRLGAYHSLTIVAPEVAERAKPGQFVSVGMPEGRAFLLRRNFSVHQSARRGGWAGTLEFAFEQRGHGTSWLAHQRAHQFLDVIGPLGKGFAYPRRLSNCLLVAEEHGAASLYFLAQELRARGKRVDMIIGGRDLDHVFKPIEGKRLSQTVAFATADGSMGDRGSVVDLLAGMVDQTGTQVIYAAGATETLRAVAELCRERRIPAQVAVEERMGCGTGLCFTCTVPLARKDGAGYDSARACTDGPVFNASRVLWDAWLGGRSTMMPTPPEGFPAVRSWPG